MTTSATTLTSLRRGDLSGVRELDLSRCDLTEFPREILGAADTLEILDLSGNSLSDLPNDFNQLRRLKVLFCSGNKFDRLPPVLGDCPALSQLGFRRAGVREVPGEALPPQLRWLTLTDNALQRLPDLIGRRPKLQKLMLAGNRLRHLPVSMADSSALELLRVGANDFNDLPSWLLDLPNLAWLAWAGNPLDAHFKPTASYIDWTDLTLGALLGEGASGKIYSAQWRRASSQQAVAVKLFKGAITSDGFPEREMAASLAAGEHVRLAGCLGQLNGHPDRALGLVMPILPPHWRPLAAPPSLDSCSRDLYDPAFRVPVEVGLRIAQCVGEAVAHLHQQGLLHGDVYAHNTLWDAVSGKAVLSDFGAASLCPRGASAERLQRLETLAWGRLLAELASRCGSADGNPAITALCEACSSPDVGARPSMREALEAVATLS